MREVSELTDKANRVFVETLLSDPAREAEHERAREFTAAEVQDEFRWRERMRPMTCGIFNRTEGSHVLWLFKNEALQVRMDAKRYEDEAAKCYQRAKLDMPSGQAYWFAQAAVFHRVAGETEQHAQRLDEAIKSLEAMLGGNLEA